MFSPAALVVVKIEKMSLSPCPEAGVANLSEEILKKALCHFSDRVCLWTMF
jgi:hypothetical protein